MPVGGGRARPDNEETTHRATDQRPGAAGVEGTGGHHRARLRCPRAAAGPGSLTATKPHWCGGRRRTPQGQAAVPVGGGRAWPGFEATRRAEGSRRGRLAGGPPPTGTQSSPAPVHTPSRYNKTARPQWGRAAVAVALGFEPRVAVTPHSISSAAPSAARTRYLTRILYYRTPRATQIDRAGWDQGHTTSQDHTAARNMGATSAYRTVENKIK